VLELELLGAGLLEWPLVVVLERCALELVLLEVEVELFGVPVVLGVVFIMPFAPVLGLPGCVLPGLGARFGLAWVGFGVPGETAPPGVGVVAGVGDSGGLVPGGDEFEGGVRDGVVVDGDALDGDDGVEGCAVDGVAADDGDALDGDDDVEGCAVDGAAADDALLDCA
jgi:hypothetical protein